jgi:hypothetical protein
MPDPSEYVVRALSRLDEISAAHELDQTCPICGHDEWSMPEAVVKMTPQGAWPEGTAFVVLPLTCMRCAYIRLHSAAHLLGMAPLEER